jgi:hypothetical protein
MISEFVRFPHTPHLAWLGEGQPRSDKVLDPDESADILSTPVVVEEKVDGANLGLSVIDGSVRVQNRGSILENRAHPQFQPLWAWLAAREATIRARLGTSLILFGEWCFARHTVAYSALPDWFLGFDVFDRTSERFWSTGRRDNLLASIDVCSVPELCRGRFTLDQLTRLVSASPSRLGSPTLEGIYIRQDEGDWLRRRAKLVRAEFVQGIDEHWMSRPLERNKLRC